MKLRFILMILTFLVNVVFFFFNKMPKVFIQTKLSKPLSHDKKDKIEGEY